MKPILTQKNSYSVVKPIGIGIFFASTLLVGCASKPIPSEQFAISKNAIDSATAAGADQYAPLEIKSAREKLTSAERSVNEKNYEVAAALAEEATTDAKLAEAKSEAEKSKSSVNEIDKSLRSLMNEVNRNQQQSTPQNNR